MQLTTQPYWDRFWKKADPGESARRSSGGSPVATYAQRVARYFAEDWSEAAMMDTYRKLSLPPRSSVLEIGSAPGTHLVRLHRVFGLNPFGVDYSHVGTECNKQVFRASGLDPDHVIEADVFSPAFLESHAGAFDVVVSRGFIEHFQDLAPVIDVHCRLVRPGGYIWINIPNYRGVNYLLKRVFSPENLPAHNLTIMKLQTFAELFAREDLETIICGYYGACHLGMSYPTRPWLRPLHELCDKAQLLLNGALRLLAGARGSETAYLSPYLLFIGRKRASCQAGVHASTDG
jgi:SAM-dependent methyltransferase